MDYKIVDETSMKKVEKEVRKLLKEGWELRGDVFLGDQYFGDGQAWCQVMTCGSLKRTMSDK